MSRYAQSSKLKFGALTAVTVTGVAFGLALLRPRVGEYVRLRGVELAINGDRLRQSDPDQALLQYKLAAVLLPQDQNVTFKLADLYLANNQPDAAVNILSRLPLEVGGLRIGEIQLKSGLYEDALGTVNAALAAKTSSNLLVLKSQILMEQQKFDEAIEPAKQALDYELGSEPAALQLGLTYAAAEKVDELSKLTTSAPAKAADTLKKVAADRVILGKVLYGRGELKAAEKVLLNANSADTESLTLLAQIKLAKFRPSKSDYELARGYLEKGAKIDPSSIELHKSLKSVYLKLHDQSSADKETDLIQQLASGKV